MTVDDPRSGCRGITPLSARLEEWQASLCSRPDLLASWVEAHGSPVNLLDPNPMARNAAELSGAAAQLGIDLRIFFARKANKALTFVDEANRLGLGVDLASERELEQALGRGVEPGDLVMTAAIKPAGLLELCVASGTTVVIDNEDELQKLTDVAASSGRAVPVALRLAPGHMDGAIRTRFGFSFAEAIDMIERQWSPSEKSKLRIDGVHFHLDGYDPDHRIDAIGESLKLIDALRQRGHHPNFLDIGGGIPMSYLDSKQEWERFWVEHRRALAGAGPPLTYELHGLGLIAHDGAVIGRANVYPYHQELIRGAWMKRVLTGSSSTGASEGSVAEAIGSRGLELRCEPGRALLDGCGMTVARVEFRKQRADGSWLIGLGMNRTQCRSTSEDFLVDPLLVPAEPSLPGVDASGSTGPIEAHLVGAYCIERELLTWRRLEFPEGVSVGDLIAFPNTAGYLMHILESSSHQIPLAKNLVVRGEIAELDPIDAGSVVPA